MKNIVTHSTKILNCALGLLAIIATLALHNQAYNYIINLHQQDIWQNWIDSSIGYLLGATIAAWLILKLHQRWSLLLAIIIAIVGANHFSELTLNSNLRLTISCIAISMAVVSIFSLGAILLEKRYIPIYFGLILFFSLTSDANDYGLTTSSSITHFALLIALLWWLLNHPFKKAVQSAYTEKQQPAALKAVLQTKTVWLLACICVLTSVWLYLWESGNPFHGWLYKLHSTKLTLKQLSELHLQSVATGAMLAALLASGFATCRKLAVTAYTASAAIILLLALAPEQNIIFNLRILFLAAMLVGFKLLTYVLCVEFFPQRKFVIVFSIVTIAKLIITPLIVFTMLHYINALFMQHSHIILTLIIPFCLLLAAFLASRLQPQPRPAHLPALQMELKLLCTGKESVGKIFWLWYIIGFYFLFSPISMQLYMIFFSNARSNNTANIAIPLLNVTYFLFLIYCLIRNSDNTRSYIWAIIAFGFFALGIAEWGIALAHGIRSY